MAFKLKNKAVLDADSIDGLDSTALQAAGNELSALQSLVDTSGFLKKLGDGSYSIDTTTYLSSAAKAADSTLWDGEARPSFTGNALKYLRVNAGGTDFEFASIAGGGDVVGPASAVDSCFAAFDTTTGKLIKDSGYSSSSFQAAGNELTALQALADTAGFLKKTGNGAYSIDTGTYLPSSGGNTPTLTITTGGTGLTVQNGVNILLGTGTGTKIGTGTTQKIGFWNATPVAKPSAFTQTYSTTDKTHNALTSSVLTNSTGGTITTTIGAAPATYSASPFNNIHASLTSDINNVRAEMINCKNLINSIIDDLQSMGLFA